MIGLSMPRLVDDGLADNRLVDARLVMPGLSMPGLSIPGLPICGFSISGFPCRLPKNGSPKMGGCETTDGTSNGGVATTERGVTSLSSEARRSGFGNVGAPHPCRLAERERRR